MRSSLLAWAVPTSIIASAPPASLDDGGKFGIPPAPHVAHDLRQFKGVTTNASYPNVIENQVKEGIAMNGAIFYSGKRGSTAQYAQWVGEATGLPVFDANNTDANPADYDFLILGSSVILMRMTIRKWVRANWDGIKRKPTLLFSVC
ncbi:flavodoxin domain-containing protein, partial [Pirellulales bacterium]|nr:flavodoxin domain-containing protein [Pirellulales bacterium]